MKLWSAATMLAPAPDGSFRRMECQESRLRAGTLGYAPNDDSVPLHAHLDSDEIFYVIQGSATFTVDNQLVEVEKGDMLHVKAGEKHRHTAGSQGVVLLAVVGPNQDDAWVEK